MVFAKIARFLILASLLAVFSCAGRELGVGSDLFGVSVGMSKAAQPPHVGPEFMNAALWIAPSRTGFRITSASAKRGGTVSINVRMDATGEEQVSAFSLAYDPSILSVADRDITLIEDRRRMPGLAVNLSKRGRIGITLNFNADGQGAKTAGVDSPLINITFRVADNAPAGRTTISFTDTPTKRVTVLSSGRAAEVTDSPGMVTIRGASGVSLSGRVTNLSGRGVGNAEVILIDPADRRVSAISDSFGLYSFANLESEKTYNLVVRSRRYRFPSRSIEIGSQTLGNVDIVAIE